MKLRSGFVSNSSSSSFIMLFPEGFDIDKIDWDAVDFSYFLVHSPEDNIRLKKVYKQAAIDGLKLLFSRGFIGTSVNDEEKGDMNRGMLWDNEVYDATWAITVLFPQYVIAEFQTGPDDGKIILVDPTRAKKAIA